MNSSNRHNSVLTLIIVSILAIALCPTKGQSPRVEEDRRKNEIASALIEKELATGNLSAIDLLNGPRDLPVLYGALQSALTHQFGDRSTEVRIVVASKIATIPGHAQYVADKVDAFSAEIGTTPKRETWLYILRHVKSRETLEVLGRFLFDNRLPERGLPVEKIDSNFPVEDNARLATTSLSRFLGVNSPLKYQLNYGQEDMKKMQEWWNSPEGVKFRKEFGSEGQPGVSGFPASAPPTANALGQVPVEKESSIWLLVGGGLAAMAGALFIWMRRRV